MLLFLLFSQRTFIFSIILACTAFSIFAQANGAKDGRYYEAEAMRAYREKNFSSFLENMKRANELRIRHPRLMYNLAVAYSLNNKPSEALSLLRAVAEMGLVMPAQGDRDLDALSNLDDFKSILKIFAANRAPRVISQPAFVVEEKGLVPESVAYDPIDDTFYLSSVYKRKIVAVTRNGESRVFSNDADGLWSVMGMKVDPERRLLWVCTTAHRQMSNYTDEDKGRSGIFEYDLRTGHLRNRYYISDRSKPHWLGDLALNRAGDVFATDSVTPAIYVLRRGQDKLETFYEGAPFVSPQGLDFSPDGKYLFMADYSQGLFLINLETKQCSSIDGNTTLLGIDGLYYYKGQLIGVQNGVKPERIVRMSLSDNLKKVSELQTLEANNPVFDEITLGVLVKDSFYFIANSQWGMIDEKGNLGPADKLKSPIVLQLPLQ